ncbi:coiled-coil domain-containing protein 102A isoform X2 [Chrysoperla carnea]|uniref:coiled-coil domain-containing protein 102A isoform X2 n=1 Tax=Chrysoperla carnea TaxID=189513 RepID=UPI001D08CA05|nr:coiled-coil domain-containing protein 102A isoform X2 [Chrysoperla carnea]
MAQSTSSGTSSRRHVRDHDAASITSSRYADTEWEAKEALRQRELEEARARAAQMEKTMRWWSDCTANWREKWSKVRNERNQAREESKQYRTKLDTALKDLNAYKREKQELELQNDQLKKEMEKIHLLLLKHAGQFDSQILEALENEDLDREFLFNTSQNPLDSTDPTNNDLEGSSTMAQEYVLQGAVPRDVHKSSNDKKDLEESTESTVDDMDRILSQTNKEDYDVDFLLQKLSMLQLRLDEASKTIQAEREEKSSLHRNLERLQVELQEARDKCEDLRSARQEAVRELLALQDQHRDELRLVQADLQDEASSREGMDRRLADLRAELERLQAENAAEWGKRERLETEKLALERDNKKLRAELRDMQDRMERKGRPLTTSDTELRQLQQDLTDKNKELSDLKHNQNKLKKILQDKITELAHTTRRAEQYEAEVKRLRLRVEELKRDLAVAEDELDSSQNNIRKLQRTNDELQEQVESFQVQLEHLHTSPKPELDNNEELCIIEDTDDAA